MTDVVAKLADGTELRFPAGTADDVIDRVVQTHLTKPENQVPVVEAPQVQAPIKPQIGAEGNLTPQETLATQPTKYFQGKSEAPGDTSIADFLAHPIDTLTGRDKVSDQSLSDLVAGQEPSGGNRPFVASAAKGVMSIKSMFNDAYLSDMIPLMEKNYKDYGSNFEKAPPEKRQSLLEDQAELVAHLNKKAEYNKDVEAVTKKYGTDAFSKKADALEATPEYQNASRLKRFQLYGNEVISNPQNIPTHIATVSLESLPATIKVLLAATIMKFMGGGPSAIAIAGGQESAAMEYASEYVDLRQQGLPHKEAHDKAGEKSVVIGFLDAVSIKSAGKALDKIMNQVDKGIVKRVLSTAKETAKELNKQGMLGASGEILGSAVSGQNIDPRAALDEYLGELATGPLEALTTYRGKVADERAADAEPAPPGGGAPPGSGTPPPTTETPQPNVVTPEALLTHVETRFKELTEKANGVPAQEIVDENGNKITISEQGAQPMTEQEISELKFLQEHQANPEKLAAGYGVTIGAPTVKGSQDVEGSLGELNGKPMPISPIYQEPKPAEIIKPAEQTAEPEVSSPLKDENGFITNPQGQRYQVFQHKKGSNFLHPEQDIGAFAVINKGQNGRPDLNLVLNKEGKLVPAGLVLTNNQSNGTAFIAKSEEQAAIIMNLLEQRATTVAGSEEYKAINEQLVKIVKGTAELNTPPAEVKPAEPAPPATPPVVETQGAIVKDSNGTDHPLPTIADAEKNGVEYSPINRDKPMYVKTDLDGVFSMIYRLFKESSHPYSSSTTTKVTSNKNATLPKTSNKNQVSVEFRPDTLSGRQLNDNEFMSYDTAHKAIESFTIHNPSSRLSVRGAEARLGANYLKKFFNLGNNPDGSITYTLKRVKSVDETKAEDERISKEYIEHINRSRGKLKYKYTRKRKPGLNTFQQSINQHETLGSALKDILARLEKAIAENKYETLRQGFTNESVERYNGEDQSLHFLSKSNRVKIGLYKNQMEMYVDIIKHLMKIDPVMKTHLYMDPYIVGGKYDTTVGFYNRVSTTLALFANGDLPTLVHEAIHAATVHYIEMNPNDPKVIKLKKLLKASRSNDKKIRGAWQNYGNTNLKEFIAEAFSDPEFIKHLKRIDPLFEKSESTSIFDNFKNIVSNMMKSMGINTQKDRSAFDEVMDLSSELFTGKTLEGYKYDLNHPLDAETESKKQTKPGADTTVIADILGQQFYFGDVPEISLKEMLQNAYDAIKPALDSGEIKEGKIDINMDESTRTITIKDNGHGMTSETLGNTFLTIAGSIKESEISSGSFGVAKIQFLYGNNRIYVATMRNGVISVLNTTGKQLKDSLKDPSLAPYTEEYTPEEYGLDKVKEDFPDGHGTIAEVSTPETYVDQDGEVKNSKFETYPGRHAVFYSPLRDNIKVTFNKKELDDIGSKFNKDNFETIANIKYPWGNVHVFASKEKDKHIDTGSNVTVLSDGLYQFLDKIPLNIEEKSDWRTKSLQRDIYFDIIPSIRANQPGYPFAIDRQGFTRKAQEDLEKIKKFIWVKYKIQEAKQASKEFGNFYYLSKKNNKVSLKEADKLTTNQKEDTKNPLNISADMESKNGQLRPNEKIIPLINGKDLEGVEIDLDQFRISQNQIDPNTTMLHDNVAVNPYTILRKQRDKLQEQMDQDQEILDKMPKFLPDTFDESTEHEALRKKIDATYQQIEDMETEMSNLPYDYDLKPITEVAREKFGNRFDTMIYDIGDIFRALRDRVFILANNGDLPEYGGSYKELKKYAMGISFDQEYLGVNMVLPFKGMFVNPMLSDFKDNYRTKAMGLFGTMIHELAHFQVRNHQAEFPKEMQRITAALEADESFDINDIRKELLSIYKRNNDILTFLNDLGGDKNDTKPIGIRIQDEQYEGRATSTVGNLAEAREDRQSTERLPSGARQRDKNAGKVRKSKSISPEAQANGVVSLNVGPMTEGEAQDEQGSRQIFNYRGDPVDIREWEIPEQGRIASLLSKWFQYFADEDAVLTKIMNTLKSLNRTISDMTDIEKKQELKNSRISAQLMIFANEEVNPIVKEMIAKGVSLEEINKYLLAKHSPAYNERMNNINHSVDRSGNIIPYRLQDRASSMSTQDANDYINELTEERKALLEDIAKKWYAIRDKTQKLLVESGQETQETIDLWNETYPFYVPLNREQEQQAMPAGLRTGSGTDVRGDFSKRATGSEKQVISIADGLLYQRERAIARAENNEVGKSIYRLFLEHPAPKFAISVNPDAIYDREALIAELQQLGYDNAADVIDNIMAEPKEKYLRKIKPSDFVIDPTTGFPIPNTKEVVDARVSRNARFGDNVLTFKMNGHERYVFFDKKNPDAITMIRTLKQLDAQQLGWFLSGNRFITHYLAQVYTVLNPIFSIVNGIKDYPFGMVNLSTTPIRGKQLQVTAKIMPAMLGIMTMLRKERAGGGYNSSIYKWQRIYSEALDAGFQTSNRYAVLHTGEDRTYITNLLDQFKDNNTKQVFRYVINMTYDFASMIENGVRLASYQQMREAGYTPQQSASVAKNLTINFDKKGSRTTILRSLYLFFNASIQGTVRLSKTLKGPSGGRILVGGILLGVMQAVLIAAAGYKDDDPPEYIRSHNLIIPTGDGKYKTIPMPYGLNILPNTGRILTEAAMDINQHKELKDAHIGKHALNWTNALFSTFSPFGNQGLSMNSLIPTSMSAPFAISSQGTNTNAFGQTISKKDSYTRPTPGYMRTKESGTTPGKEFARWMNKFTLGTDYTKGGWSPTGDDIDFLASTYLGPVLGSINKTYEYAKAKVSGEEVPSYKVPVLGRFQGETNSKPVITSRFYANLNAMYEHEFTIKNLRNDQKALNQYYKDHPDAKAWNMAEVFNAKINQLSAAKKQKEMNGAPKAVLQRIDNIKIIQMNKFNDAIEKIRNQ